MTNFALVPIPMFLLMGELFYHTGLATRCFNAADKLLGNIRGRLAYVTLIGGTAYAGPAGSSMGACALLGRLMAPEMMRRGYSKYLSIGPIMGVGGLAVIIPPSALTVLLATLGQTDVGALLIAGVIPGLHPGADVRRADLGLDGDRPERGAGVQCAERVRGARSCA